MTQVNNNLGVEVQEPHPNFIESNTQAITLEELSEKSIVPTFSDNSLTISHQDFMMSVYDAAEKVFGELTPIECRVSHPINGRVPTALNKKASELTDAEKTVYYQRLAWISHVSNLKRTINGQEVCLTIGGVRGYNDDNLYSRPAPMRFKKALDLYASFNPEKDNNLEILENLQDTRIDENQFCNIIGRMRLYQALPVAQQHELPQLILGDQAVNEAVRQYVNNPNFGRRQGNDISTWDLMQLFNEAVKSSYIDKWLERNQNCTDFSLGIQRALQNKDEEGYSWFLN